MTSNNIHAPLAEDGGIDENWLRESLARQPVPPGPFLGPEARERIARRSAWRSGAMTAVALLALGLTALLIDAKAPSNDPVAGSAQWDGQQARGAEASAAVELAVLIEGDGLRRAANEAIAADERVLFRFETTIPGFLCLDERGEDGWRRVLPDPGERWHVDAGQHLPRAEGALQAFRTDHGSGARTYRAQLDTDDPDCGSPAAESLIELRWD